MNFTVLPIIFTCLALFVITLRTVRFIRKEQGQTLFKLIATVVLWGSISYISLYPIHLRTISRQLGFGENLNTFIFFGFVGITAILFQLFSYLEKLERQLTEIVRKNALKDL